MFPEAVVFPLMYAPPPYKIPLALILPDAVIFVKVEGELVNPEPSP